MFEQTTEFFDTLAKVLLRCWIFGFVLLFIWLGAFLSGAVHNLHGPLMDLSDHDLNVIHYCGIGLVKIEAFTLFLFPYIAIQLVLRRRR